MMYGTVAGDLQQEVATLVADFEAVPGVDQVSPVSSHQAVWQGLRLTAVGVDPAHYFQAFQLAEGERTAAFKQMRRGDGVLIPLALAREMDLHVGDPFPLSARDQSSDFVIAGIIVHSLPTADGFGAVVLSLRSSQGSGSWPVRIERRDDGALDVRGIDRL